MIAASRRAWNELPWHAFSIRESSSLVKKGTGFSVTFGACIFAIGFENSSSSDSQAKNCSSARYC